MVLQVNVEDPSLANFPPPLPPLETFWDAQALGFVVLWILFQALLYILPVGKVSERSCLFPLPLIIIQYFKSVGEVLSVFSATGKTHMNQHRTFFVG